MSSNSENKSVKTWHALDVETAEAASEAVEYALMEAGALGTETGTTTITGYFDLPPNREQVRAQLADSLRIYGLPTSAVRDMNLREVANQDWLGEWKKSWQPVVVGRFIIAPPWSDVPDSTEHIVIRIEPGMAFGTGTHETTRLCLAAIEQYFEGGSFLDVGTGTGILAIAAAKLFPVARVMACDLDEDAVAIARENARLNHTDQHIEFRVGSIEETTPSADFVCANLTADVICAIMLALVGVTCGRLVLSGILVTQLDEVVARLRECGVSDPPVTMLDGEWAAIII